MLPGRGIFERAGFSINDQGGRFAAAPSFNEITPDTFVLHIKA
jgi:hypothetical protein